MSLVTPSGNTIGYVYDSSFNNGTSAGGYLGRVSAITLNGVYVIGFAQYQAFGPASGWAWGNHGNGSIINLHQRLFDLDTRPTSIASDPEGYNRDIKWDQANRITGITVPGTSNGVPTITIPGITNAMSVNQAYQYDALDRLTSMIPGNPAGSNAATGLAFLPKEQFSFDAIGNRLSRATTPPGSTTAATATYAYPNTSATPLASRKHTLTGITGSTTWAYLYDATGNTTKEGSNPANAATTAFTHTYDAKNRLSKTQIGSTTANTVTYKINALGQRLQKTGAGTYVYSTSTTINTTTGLSPQATTLQYNARYVYDEQGRLLGEYTPDGKLISETIWFDDLPVATIRPKGSSAQLPLGIAGTGTTTANNTGANTSANPVNVDTFYLHPDHLGTPRVATRSVAVAGATTGPNAVNKAVWRWESDPFGTSGATGAGGSAASAPNENPQQVTGTQTQIQAASFKLNNRFPGQLFDAESSKSYNYFRDYDSSIGRYVESDPIGLRGGPNTFGYVGQNPTSRRDEFGLAEMCYYRGWYNGKSDWPHQFICVGGGCRGFYPYSSDPDKDLSTMILSPGEISEDDAQYKSKSSCFQLPSCNEKAMNKCVLKCKKASFYSLAGSSCINWANNCYESCLVKGCASK